MKYKTNKILSDFEFHDSYFKLKKYENDSLIISVKYLNVHKNTEQNPSNTDMEIKNAEITFEGFRLVSFEPPRTWKEDINGKLYTDEPLFILEGTVAKAKFSEQLNNGVTVLEFGILENGNYYFDGLSVEPWFSVQFQSDTCVVTWDEFSKPSFYENLNK
jgi:hypothetical protein